MPLIKTKGSASSQAYGQFARQAAAPVYIEDVFSTYLYSGTGATQNIVNGIDFAGKGGMVWIKARTSTTYNNNMVWATDVNDGYRFLQTNTTGAWTTDGNGAGVLDATGRQSNGFQLASTNLAANTSSVPYVSWSFRKQPKFFDVVTWTGDDTASRPISHILGSVPGFIIVKRTSLASNFFCYHRSIGPNFAIYLNSTAVPNGEPTFPATPTSSVFYVQGNANAGGSTYVGYVFAHDAGGFGLTGTDNVITCGTYTGNGSVSGPTVSLGYEPQWLMIKPTSFANNWAVFDNMRGMSVGGNDPVLRANTAGVEASYDALSPTATGFQLTTTGSEVNASGATYIYIAVRRGPMKVPTSGTSVFTPVAYTGTASSATITTGIVTDAAIFAERVDPHNTRDGSRLTGTGYLSTNTSDEERNGYSDGLWQQNPWDVMNGVKVANTLYGNTNYVSWAFRRAPGFFDVVCYTGDGTNPRYISHNLGAVPEFIIVKRRGIYTQNWLCYHASLNFAYRIDLNSNAAAILPGYAWYNTPTATQFSTQLAPNSSGETYIAYLFASCPGVSKVGGYSGTGAFSQQINCGFTGGARFVMIKRTDSTGDWYVWDTARGIISGNDPYLLLNSTAAETTGTDYIDPLSSGFEISSTAPAAINASGGTFIYLAIA